jgi:hypothetical protein
MPGLLTNVFVNVNENFRQVEDGIWVIVFRTTASSSAATGLASFMLVFF